MTGEADEGNISGMLVQSHEEHFRKRLSPSQYEQYRASLSDADRRAIDDARPLGWTPIAVSDRSSTPRRAPPAWPSGSFTTRFSCRPRGRT